MAAINNAKEAAPRLHLWEISGSSPSYNDFDTKGWGDRDDSKLRDKGRYMTWARFIEKEPFNSNDLYRQPLVAWWWTLPASENKELSDQEKADAKEDPLEECDRINLLYITASAQTVQMIVFCTKNDEPKIRAFIVEQQKRQKYILAD